MEAEFVADPFMIKHNSCWYMFFEVFDAVTRRGSIGLAESRNLRGWRYRKIVVREPFHLSYPHVFRAEGSYYIVMETLGRGCVSLYRADCFPTGWSFVRPLISGEYADPSIVWHDGKWWLFVCASPYAHDVLRLFFADSLEGDWKEHPASPIVNRDARRARPAGRVIAFDGTLIRYAQDCHPVYGSMVRAFSIDSLTDRDYTEHEVPQSPVLRPGEQAWNQGGMHHVDVHRLSLENWIACVDGWSLFEN